MAQGAVGGKSALTIKVTMELTARHLFSNFMKFRLALCRSARSSSQMAWVFVSPSLAQLADAFDEPASFLVVPLTSGTDDVLDMVRVNGPCPRRMARLARFRQPHSLVCADIVLRRHFPSIVEQSLGDEQTKQDIRQGRPARQRSRLGPCELCLEERHGTVPHQASAAQNGFHLLVEIDAGSAFEFTPKQGFCIGRASQPLIEFAGEDDQSRVGVVLKLPSISILVVPLGS